MAELEMLVRVFSLNPGHSWQPKSATTVKSSFCGGMRSAFSASQTVLKKNDRSCHWVDVNFSGGLGHRGNQPLDVGNIDRLGRPPWQVDARCRIGVGVNHAALPARRKDPLRY
jgi:hypothetical protein